MLRQKIIFARGLTRESAYVSQLSPGVQVKTPPRFGERTSHYLR